MIPVYYCEASGNRLFQYGVGLTQLGESYQPFLSTWDLTPAGENGVCIFRSINAELYQSNGYLIAITPVIDGVPLASQVFQGVGTGEVRLEAPFAVRGTRISAQLQMIDISGEMQLRNIRATYVPIRVWPQP